MFCVPELIFGSTEGVLSHFHVLRSRTHFRRCVGRRVPLSAFPRALGPVFMFCVPILIFGATEGVGSRFHILCSRTCFQRFRGRRVPFSCFASSYSFSAVARVSGPVFMFCAHGLIFGDTEGVGSLFHVLCSRTRFRRYRGRRDLLSCFALPDSFSAITRASGSVFMFCAPELIFGGTDGVRSRFHVLRSLARFRRCGGRWVPFSCFALPYTFSTVPRASGPVFMFCTPGLIFGDPEGIASRLHVLHARIHIRRYRRRPLLFSCFALTGTFLAVRRV
jgi:hypothetical protein